MPNFNPKKDRKVPISFARYKGHIVKMVSRDWAKGKLYPLTVRIALENAGDMVKQNEFVEVDGKRTVRVTDVMIDAKAFIDKELEAQPLFYVSDPAHKWENEGYYDGLNLLKYPFKTNKEDVILDEISAVGEEYLLGLPVDFQVSEFKDKRDGSMRTKASNLVFWETGERLDVDELDKDDVPF